MTLVTAWIRSTGGLHELVVAADSRLSGGGATWDACPKIVGLPRTDAVVAFSGFTDLGYPTLVQWAQAVRSNRAMQERRYDVTDLSHLLHDVLNQMLDLRLVDGVVLESALLEKRDTNFLLAGWSWRYQRFYIWRYYFDPNRRNYMREKVKPSSPRVHVLFMGDAHEMARSAYKDLRRERGLTLESPLNMEPFEVLRDLIRSGTHLSVGGAPQVVKIYRHMNVEPFGVMWRRAPGSEPIPSYGGRPLMDYEKPYYSFIDTDDPGAHANVPAVRGVQARAVGADDDARPTHRSKPTEPHNR